MTHYKILWLHCSNHITGTAEPKILVEIALFKKGWVTLSVNFRGRGSSTNEFWLTKTRVPGLSRDVVLVILRLAVLMQYKRVTHGQTHGQTDTR